MASIDPRDQHHVQSRDDLQRIESDRAEILIYLPTLFESHVLIARRLGMTAGLRWLDDIRSGTAVLQIQPTDLDEASRILRRLPDQTVTLFDAALAVISRLLDLPVWTYDHHFDVMGVRVWR
ncbi:MAG: type II toxin-antitoxin system VapC family toxin [Thermomicrobiales bacterium]